jgi:hypothetical protein
MGQRYCGLIALVISGSAGCGSRDQEPEPDAGADDSCRCLMLTSPVPPDPQFGAIEVGIPSFTTHPAAHAVPAGSKDVRSCEGRYCAFTDLFAAPQLLVTDPVDPARSVAIELPRFTRHNDFTVHRGKAYVLTNLLGDTEQTFVTNSIHVYDLAAPEQPARLISLPQHLVGFETGPHNTAGDRIAIAGGRAFVLYFINQVKIRESPADRLAIIDIESGEILVDLRLFELNRAPLVASGDFVYAEVKESSDNQDRICLQQLTTERAAPLGCRICPPADRYFRGAAPGPDGSLFVAVGDSDARGPVQRLTSSCTLEPDAYVVPAARAIDIELCGDYLVASDIFGLDPGTFVVAEHATRTPVTVPPLDLLAGLPREPNVIACAAR